jgi:hypothetical protein
MEFKVDLIEHLRFNFPRHFVIPFTPNLLRLGYLEKGKPMDHSLILPINEITILMGISALGIMTLIGLFLYLTVDAFFGKTSTLEP